MTNLALINRQHPRQPPGRNRQTPSSDEAHSAFSQLETAGWAESSNAIKKKASVPAIQLRSGDVTRTFRELGSVIRRAESLTPRKIP